MNGATAVLLPTIPARVRIPPSMRETERTQLIKELGEISTEIAKLQVRDEEREKFLAQRWRAIDARIAKLELGSDASGAHDLALVQKALDKKTDTLDKWKWYALSIVAALTTLAAGYLLGS